LLANVDVKESGAFVSKYVVTVDVVKLNDSLNITPKFGVS